MPGYPLAALVLRNSEILATVYIVIVGTIGHHIRELVFVV